MTQLTAARRFKLALAALGGAALVTMTGLSMATGDMTTTDLPPAASPVLPKPMTQGETVDHHDSAVDVDGGEGVATGESRTVRQALTAGGVQSGKSIGTRSVVRIAAIAS